MRSHLPTLGAIPRRVFPARWITLALIAPALLLSSSGCSRVRVHSMTDPDASFTSYASFAFLPNGGRSEKPRNLPPRLRRLADPLYKASVQDAIEIHLEARGLRSVSRGSQPDLLIGYRTVVKDQARAVPPIYGVGWRGRVHVVRPGHVKWYKEGTLVIDVIDRKGEHLVWRGIGVGAMRDIKPGAPLNEAVGEILSELPME
ncbi:MAG: DUF4136 domain-containing protein [Candidatus Eisenbacteria bacterium]|nr:DUF4136 domain-containing protein [Candidatus Eisenbacteria bacterium]